MSILESNSIEYYESLKSSFKDKYKLTDDSDEKEILKIGFNGLKDWACDYLIPSPDPDYDPDTVEDIIYLIKNEKEEMISFAILNRESGDKPWFLHFIYTEPVYRKQGYAYKLLNHIKSKHNRMVSFVDGHESEKLFSKLYKLEHKENNILPMIDYTA